MNARPTNDGAKLPAYAIYARIQTVLFGFRPCPSRPEFRTLHATCGLALRQVHGDGKAAFAICRACDRVVETPLSNDDQAALLSLARNEIEPERLTVEIAGLCENCRRAQPA